MDLDAVSMAARSIRFTGAGVSSDSWAHVLASAGISSGIGKKHKQKSASHRDRAGNGSAYCRRCPHLISRATKKNLALAWAMRRYVYTRLIHDEKGTPMHRRILKMKKMIHRRACARSAVRNFQRRGLNWTAARLCWAIRKRTRDSSITNAIGRARKKKGLRDNADLEFYLLRLRTSLFLTIAEDLNGSRRKKYDPRNPKQYRNSFGPDYDI